METKKCEHESISYGRINKWFILDCSDCGKIIRIDDYDTQLKIISEFKLLCECGKQMIIEQVDKKTCKWTKYINKSCAADCHDEPKMYSQSCDKENLLSRKQDDFIFCPYCGKEIEESKE